MEARAKEFKGKGRLSAPGAVLEEAYSERIFLKGGDGLAWNPIDSVVEDVRRTYVKVVKVFLMLKDGSPGSDKQSL